VITDPHEPHTGPKLLVQTIIYADGQMLLQRRGLDPYAGQWAPAGGFVEAGESLEGAAVREIQEEVGVEVAQEQLIPHGILSLPALNEVVIVYLAVLNAMVPPRAAPPEVLEARWFSEFEMAELDRWPPARAFDLHRVFDRARRQRLEIYQQSATFLRLVSTDCETTYLWQAASAPGL
jgi:ADP-ribose pyrophosphatase YjhB (NUDIX family)